MMFKVGDDVTIVKGSRFEGIQESNLPHGTIGKIIDIEYGYYSSLNIRVRWPVGLTNVYNKRDLEPTRLPEMEEFL